MKKKLIFFDFETNGVKGTDSVLSLSASKILYDLETNQMLKLGTFNRFYFRNEGEAPNLDAIKVNGLTDEKIEYLRSLDSEKYARTFLEDVDNFYAFCDGAIHFIAHNIRFDRQFLPFALPVQFDTMLENQYIVKIPHEIYEGKFKWPKLNECAKYYNVPLEEDKLHGSMYDVEIMARVFYRMTQRESTLRIIRRFVDDEISTRM